MPEAMPLVVHAAATWFLAGLIWFVQVVHYAMFDQVGEAGYQRYQHDHMRLTTYVVAPAMLVEGAMAVWLLFARPEAIHDWLAWLGLALLALIWLSTATLQVPAHRKLEHGFDAAAHRRLVATNWLRTALWTARGVIAGAMLMLAMPQHV